LHKYCLEQSSASHDQVDFPEILASWSFASESNDESLLAAVPAALTQFYRTISGRLEFRDFGLSLCHSLLKREQLRIFDRALSTPRVKDYLIASNLQLLIELINFDGGTLASNVFSKRDYLYRRLDGILGSGPQDQQHFAAHQAALRFFAANLKHIDTAAKIELLDRGRTVYSAIRNIPAASSEVVLEVLDALDKYIIEDNNLSKQLKARCLNSGVLTALSQLYGYSSDSDGGQDNPGRTVQDVVHQLLVKICTGPKVVLLPQSGWYPIGSNPETLEQDEDMIDLGLDSPFHLDDYTGKVPVRNGALSAFLQSLEPESNLPQSSLVTLVFEAAPELVADYFSKNSKLVVSPQDDPVWRGQFAFLFSVVQLPVPKNCGWHDKLPLMPPPLTVVVESILPKPLDRTIITQCLQSTDTIMTLSAARLLTVSVEKLETVLKMFDQASSQHELWRQASVRLASLLMERIPPLQDLIKAFQRLDTGNERLAASLLESMATYYRVVPSITATPKFDVGPIISKALIDLEVDDLEDGVRASFYEQVTHLLHIAEASTATRWWHKPSGTTLAPVVQLLKFCAQTPDHEITKHSLPMLKKLLHSKGILHPATRSVDALLVSLASAKKWQPEMPTLNFLENCMMRTSKSPVKYLDQVEAIQQDVSDNKELSLLACCVAEQWPFVTKNDIKDEIKNVAGWIARFFWALDSVGENYRVMTRLQETMLGVSEGHEILQKALEKQRKKPTVPAVLNVLTTQEVDQDAVEHLASSSSSDFDLPAIFPLLPRIPTSLSGLTNWTNIDFESAIHTGRLANLLRGLLSREHEIALQAFHTLQTTTALVEQSTYIEKTQLYLLLGELSETIKQDNLSNSMANDKAPLPTIVIELAIHFLSIISDPSSPFYRKTNEFLLRSPVWSIRHIIPHFIASTFLSEPEADDTDLHSSHGSGTNAQHAEIDAFLVMLVSSLRHPTDMDLYRRSGIFPRVFTYYLAPVCPKPSRLKILNLVYNAANIPEGADTLITRTGVREWLDIVKGMRNHSGHGTTFGKVDEELRDIVMALRDEVERKCNAEVIRKWEETRPIFKDRKENGVQE
jgi:nucleolar pre-ribosomal-associated protein 1